MLAEWLTCVDIRQMYFDEGIFTAASASRMATLVWGERGRIDDDETRAFAVRPDECGRSAGVPHCSGTSRWTSLPCRQLQQAWRMSSSVVVP